MFHNVQITDFEVVSDLQIPFWLTENIFFMVRKTPQTHLTPFSTQRWRPQHAYGSSDFNLLQFCILFAAVCCDETRWGGSLCRHPHIVVVCLFVLTALF
uniref:Uncharacterized protein n=1 Tax=Anguilla anguilla TaxID=7936 RepID=A0A0E9T1M6_ANGAN